MNCHIMFTLLYRGCVCVCLCVQVVVSNCGWENVGACAMKPLFPTAQQNGVDFYPGTKVQPSLHQTISKWLFSSYYILHSPTISTSPKAEVVTQNRDIVCNFCVK